MLRSISDWYIGSLTQINSLRSDLCLFVSLAVVGFYRLVTQINAFYRGIQKCEIIHRDWNTAVQ